MTVAQNNMSAGRTRRENGTADGGMDPGSSSESGDEAGWDGARATSREEFGTDAAIAMDGGKNASPSRHRNPQQRDGRI